MVFLSLLFVHLLAAFISVIGGTHWSYRDNLATISDHLLKKLELDIVENSSIISNLEKIIFFDSQKEIEIQKGCEFIVKGDKKVFLVKIEIHEKDNNWVFKYKSHELLVDKKLKSSLREYKYVHNTFFGLSLPLRIIQITTVVSVLLTVITAIILTVWFFYIIHFSWWL